MAEGKVIGKLTNIVNFSTNKASLNKVLADIKKVKDAMKGVTQPFAKVQQQTTRANKQQARMKSDYLVVQKQLDKTEKSQLKTAEAIYKAKNKQALAEQKIANQRRAQSVRGLTSKSGAGRASQTAFADMLRQEERASKQTNRATATANNRNMRVDRRAQATQEWFGDTFGRGGSKKAAGLYNDMRAGKISAEQYSSRLRTLRAELYRNQRAQRGFNQSIHDMRGAFVQATASYTAFAGVMGIANTGKKFQGYQSTMEMAFGGEKEAAPFQEYLRKEIRRLGLDVSSTTEDFSKFAVATKGKISGDETKNIFSGFMQYATAAGAGKERTSLGINAIQQMFGKDFVYSEEFRQQLADNVAGAGTAFYQAASEMMGHNVGSAEFTELMKSKKLPTEKLLPIVAKYWKAMTDNALGKKLQQLAAVEARMVESWTRFTDNLYSSGVEAALSNLYKGLDRILYSIKNLAGNALGKYLKGVLDMLSESALFVLDTFQLIFYYIDKSFGNDSNLKGFTAEMLGQVSAAIGLFFMLRKILAVMGLLKLAAMLFKNKLQEAAAEDIAGGLEKQSSRFKGVGSILGKVLGAAVAWEVGTAIGEYLRNNFSVVKDLGDWMGLNLAQRFNPNSQDAVGGRNAFAAMNGAGFNAAWASSMPMFMQNQQPQTAKVELTLNGELSKMVDVKIKENNTQTIQSILPMSKN